MSNDDDKGGPPPMQAEEEPYFNMDPDDPNYIHKEKYEKWADLIHKLPEGWKKNDDREGSIKAPFIHESGKVSWRHPNRELMHQLTQQQKQEEEAKRAEANSPAMRSLVKRLRLMLQSGLPLGAVEQRAKLEGIDMALVLETPPYNARNSSPSAPPSPLVKKYKRMLKRGVQLPAVQQLAHMEGGMTPEQLVEACADVLGDNQQHRNAVDGYAAPKKRPKTTTCTKKYQRMQQAGVPMGAIVQTVRRNGDNVDQVMAVLNGTDESTGDDANTYFTPLPDGGDKVSFPSNSDLGALVRKMAQTVQKRASADSNAMLVDTHTLYHALGALQGVQLARDRYNSTISISSSSHQQQAARAKRQEFLEIARTIGMAAPTEFTTPVEIAGLDELLAFIQKTFYKELTAVKDQLQEGWYDFDSLALLYAPGTKVVAKNAGGGGVDMMCQVAWNRYEQGRTIMGQPMKYFSVCFQYVVAVGASHATMAEVVEGMESFEGRRDVQRALTFVPLSAYSEEEQTRLLARYRRRGELYNRVALKGSHAYMSYQKGCFFLKRGGGMKSTSGNPAAALATGGRVIVDTQGAYDHGHSLSVGYDPMVLGVKFKYKEYSLHLRSVQQETAGASEKASDSDGGLILFDQVPDDYLDMVWPMVVGFSLEAKAWGDILVDGLEDIQFSQDIFDRLVLPENRKRMVKALVRHSTTSFQDLVQGKGEGTVFLLYGPPGVGKTLTAEAIAELLHKPLYSLSMGTLGTTPGELEQRLGEIMNLAAKWDALILLDEADSFLETRSANSSLERNAMVSVMLKLVEYFSGILFLTSNRIDSLDPAFQTRITLALRYEELSLEARTKVWTNLMIKSGFQAALDEGTIDPVGLAKTVLNGREIKNALRLAMALAAEEEQPLTQDILLETVVIVTDYKSVIPSVGGEAAASGGWFSWWK